MDLNAPLGLNKPPKRSSRRILPLALGASAVAALTVGLVVVLTQADPKGGEPYAVALVPPLPPPKAPPQPSAPDPTPTGSIAAPAIPDKVSVENGVRVVSPDPSVTAQPRNKGPLVIDVSKALDERARKVASKDNSERAGLPKVTTGAPRPRIAIVVGALGLSEQTTRTAVEMMPAAVSFAFVPNGDAKQASSLESAKAKGHEILLQLPMQSAQGAVTGPHALRAGEPAADLARDLAWLTSRFDGYVGVVNLLGAPVTANPTAMSAILKAVGQRKLFYLDDGTSRRSIAVSVGASLAVPTAQADVVLDATGDPAVVQANLEKLVRIAAAKGSAIGMASGLTDHLAAVSRFATTLDAKGFTLVPVSSLAGSTGGFATAR